MPELTVYPKRDIKREAKPLDPMAVAILSMSKEHGATKPDVIKRDKTVVKGKFYGAAVAEILDNEKAAKVLAAELRRAVIREHKPYGLRVTFESLPKGKVKVIAALNPPQERAPKTASAAVAVAADGVAGGK